MTIKTTTHTEIRAEISPESQLSILFVCTGNICRSPLAEHLLSSFLQHDIPEVKVSSAGTRALLEGSVPEEIRALAAEAGSEIGQHQPRQVTAGMIGNADLILTAERSHRSEVVSLVPRAANKTFTLNQFARLAREHEAAVLNGTLNPPAISSLRDLIAEVGDYRSVALPPDTVSQDDIADPYLRSRAAYRQAGDEINAGIETIAALLRKYSVS